MRHPIIDLRSWREVRLSTRRCGLPQLQAGPYRYCGLGGASLMAKQVLTDVGIWIGGVAYDFVSNAVSLEATADAPESTTFRNGGWRDRAEGGLKTCAFTLSGYVDTEGPGAESFESLADDRDVMVAPEATMAPGDVAYVIPVTISSHSPLSGSIGDLAAFAYAAEGDGQPYRAQVLDIREGVTADVTGGRVQLGAVAAGQTFRVWVHVARRGGRVDLDLRSAVGQTGGAGTSQATLDDINATGLYELSVDGPVTDEWWFLHYDITGAASDFDIAAAAAIA